MISEQTTAIYLPCRSNDISTNDSNGITNDDVFSIATSLSPHGFDIDNPNFCTCENVKIIDMIELYCKEVTPAGRDAKHYDNSKVVKDLSTTMWENSVNLKLVYVVPRASA